MSPRKQRWKWKQGQQPWLLKKKISEQKCNYFAGKKKHFRGCRIATEDDVCGDCCWRCCEECEEEEEGGSARETHTHTRERGR